MRIPVFTALLLALAGCGQSKQDTGAMSMTLPVFRQSISHYVREIPLTADNPTDKKLGITLMRVEPDGAAVISVEETHEILRASIGQPFLGRRGGKYNVRTFGEHGLTLKSTDVRARSAVLEAYWAEYE